MQAPCEVVRRVLEADDEEERRAEEYEGKKREQVEGRGCFGALGRRRRLGRKSRCRLNAVSAVARAQKAGRGRWSLEEGTRCRRRVERRGAGGAGACTGM